MYGGGSVADQVVERHGVATMGFSNTAGQLAADASALYARNLFNFLSALWHKDASRPVLDEEIGAVVRLTKGGAIVNERLKS
jgi:NAD(P) transhydrogenase subunit alpha